MLLTLSVISCAKHLDVSPQSQVPPESYFNDAGHLSAYTVARYPGVFRTTEGTGGAGLYLDDAATDNMTNRGGHARFLPGQWRVGDSGGGWTFGGIFEMNYFLQTVLARRAEGLISGNATHIDHYIGEAYLMRAFIYFGRLMEMGDYPIITEPLLPEQAPLVEASQRRPRNEVARFILADLDQATELLLSTPPAGGRNRITRDLALLIKSRVALFEATWLKYHKGTALVPQGPSWPGSTKGYNSDYQFPSGSIDGEINFFLDEAMSASKAVADVHALTQNSKVIRESLADPSNPYVEMFNSEDLSSFDEVLLWRDYDQTLGIPQYWNHYLYYGNGFGFTRQFVDNFLMENGLPIYASGSDYQGDDFVGDVKMNRDWRLKLFMRGPGEIKAFVNLPAGSEPEIEPTVPNIDLTARFQEGTGYSIKKGLSYDNNMQAVVGRDFTAVVCFRAAEAYLNYLEACFERNGSLDGTAIAYWRALRERAGINPDYEQTISATNMSIEGQNDWGAYSHGTLVNATIYNIRRERRAELMAEGLRYMDLIRWRAMDQLDGFKIEGIKVWGPMSEVYGNRLLFGGTTTNTASDPSLSNYLRVHQIAPNNLYYNGYFFTEAHYLSPIAVDHFLISSSDGRSVESSPIYQNPGWPTVAGAGPTGF